jgi:type I restriction enzyme S subunit
MLWFDNGGTIPSVNNEKLKNFKLPYIKTTEQQQIAEYLDKKCGEIDRVVETEKAVIEKLKEYKQSIITEAVTKGLDKSAPLKDSGIEWIDKIPQHWKVIKLKKTISLIADIDHYMPNTTDTGYSYLMTGDLKDVASKIDFENCKHISESDYKDLSKKIHPILDDVIFARYATIGTVCYVDIQRDFLVSYSCLTIRPDSEKLFGKFLYYYLMSDTFKIEVSQYINSNTQSNIGLDSLQKVYMVLPDKNEQQQIAEYLDKKCSEIDKAIADKEQVIEKFTEYKKSLIYECVTGKKRVV